MDSTLDNSQEKIYTDQSIVEERLFIEEFLPLTKEKSEIAGFIQEIKNVLIHLLGSIKLNFEYYSTIRENLEVIITRIEELILLSLNLSIRQLDTTGDDSSAKKFEIASQIINCLKKMFELLIVIFHYTTNNTFLDLFLIFFSKFLKKTHKLSEETKILLMKHFYYYMIKIYHILIDKKMEYLDFLTDSKITVKMVGLFFKIISMLESYNEFAYFTEIKPYDLFNFLMMTNYNIFNLSKNIFIEKISKKILEIFNIIFRKDGAELINANNTEMDYRELHYESICKISEFLIAKMMEISKFKDELKNSIDYTEQSFHVSTLILCLKLFKKIMKIQNMKLVRMILNDKVKEKLTRVIIELSFWDNSTVVDHTCKIFRLLWKKCIETPNFGMRSDIEKITEYIFLRRYQTYINFLGDPSNGDSNIKLSVLEILTKHLNHLLSSCRFLILAYVNYDLSKIRFNLINEIFNSLQKYYTLHSPRFDYLKKLISLTYLVAFNEIYSHANLFDKSNSFLQSYEAFSDLWTDFQRMINNGQFKKIYEKLCDTFNLTKITKNVEISTLPEDMQLQYKKLARSFAVLIRYSYYVDINILFEVIAENHSLSTLMLEEYTNTFNFSGMDILKAYELYVSTFKLTGEQYHLYNFIVAFAHKYYIDNEGSGENFYFKSEEEVSTFAYSIMILNTDLHNPNISVHMTGEEFIKNNLGTQLFTSFPMEYFKSIYNRISTDPLKAPLQRANNYIKDEDVFLGIASKRIYSCYVNSNYNEYFFNKLPTDYPERMNIHSNLLSNTLPIELYPLMNVFEDFHCSNSDNPHFNELYSFLWEDLFYNFMCIPHKFYEMKDDNVLKILEKVCMISLKYNQRENIDKLIMSIHSIISAEGNAKRSSNNILPYNLFFKISIGFSKNFHSYLEIYYQAILDIIKHKLNDEDNSLRSSYLELIELIITKTFSIINAKKNIRSNNSGLFGYLFSSKGNSDEDYSIDQYKSMIIKGFGMNDNWIKIKKEIISTNPFNPGNQSSSPNSAINSSRSSLNATGQAQQTTIKEEKDDDGLIDISSILEIIKTQEEEFIFFVTLAASKILDFTSKNEYYFSLIFLNEILQNISQKDFIKIWQNLYNIFKSKMEFKRIFDRDENLFDLLYANHFLHDIMARYSTVIEIDDYYQLLENYQEIDNNEILYIVMEHNDKLIAEFFKSNRFVNDKIFEQIISLLHKLIEGLSIQCVSFQMKNNPYLPKLEKSIRFFSNLISSIRDVSILMTDSLNLIQKIIKVFYEFHLVNLFSLNSYDGSVIQSIINLLVSKMTGTLPQINDEKWELYMFIEQFSFKCTLIENEEIQMTFMALLLSMLEKPRLPMMRYSHINNILSNYYSPFVNLKVKYDNFWIDIFKIFYLLFTNNEELPNSTTEMDVLWSLFIKKYLISFVDFNKKTGKYAESAYKDRLCRIFDFALNIVKGATDKPAWWESTKNIIKLYFPDLVKDS